LRVSKSWANFHFWACNISLTSCLLHSERGLLCWGRGHAGSLHGADSPPMTAMTTI